MNDKLVTQSESDQFLKDMKASKLIDKVQDKLCKKLSKGIFPSTACSLVKLHYSLYKSWLQKGEQGDLIYKDFYDAVNQALAEGEAYHVEIMYDAAGEDWRASREYLKMRWAEKYNRQVASVEHVFAKLSDEQLLEAQRAGQNALEEMEKRIMGALTALGIGEIVEGELLGKEEKDEFAREEDEDD